MKTKVQSRNKDSNQARSQMNTKTNGMSRTRTRKSNKIFSSNTHAHLFNADLSLFVFLLYFVTKPIYLFPSGGLQIADVFPVLAILMIIPTAKIQLPVDSAKTTVVLFLFVLYTIIVNAFWAVSLHNFEFLKVCAFYLYNFILFLLFQHYAVKHHDYFFKLVALSLIIAVLVQVILSFVISPPTGLRQMIVFNNPNQLAYWTLLSACIFSACTFRIKLHFAALAVFYASILYLILISLSKAAMFATVALLFILILNRPRFLFIALAVGIPALIFLQDGQILENVFHRLDSLGEQRDDSLSARGYDRIWLYPEFLIFGSGEGAQARFNPQHFFDQYEFHSTLGTVLFSYGVVGFTLFVLFVWYTYSHAGLYYSLLFVPPFLYGLAHQGLRFSLLWLLFSAIATSRAVFR